MILSQPNTSRFASSSSIWNYCFFRNCRKLSLLSLTDCIDCFFFAEILIPALTSFLHYEIFQVPPSLDSFYILSHSFPFVKCFFSLFFRPPGPRSLLGQLHHITRSLPLCQPLSSPFFSFFRILLLISAQTGLLL